MDLFRPRAIQALGFFVACGALAAHADCSAINGTYEDESIDKPDGITQSLTSFASPKDRGRLVRQEQTGPKPTFGSGGAVMQRPKTVKLVSRVGIAYGAELKLRYLDASGKLLAETSSLTPRKWSCVSGRLERKFQTTSGLGNVMRTEEVEQVLMAAPGGELTFIETTRVVEGPRTAPKRTEVRFSRVKTL